MKPTVTVFTPTYNRKELLKRCYESLKRQTLKDFIWLIVDDGSTDRPGAVVEEWKKAENGFEIKYIYKENGGLHTAYNIAIKYAETELCICIDSDDFAPDDCIDKIVTFWRTNGSDKYAGIIGLDYDLSGNCIGDEIPEQKSISLIDLTIGKYPIKNADRKLVVRTALYKQVAPMPSFAGEKNFNPQYMHIKIAMEKEFLVLNKCLCYVDYQPQGMSNSIFKQYYNSPNSFAEIRLQDLAIPDTNWIFKLKKSIHYCSSCFLAKRKKFVKDSPCKVTTLIALFPGYVFSKIVILKNKF